MILGCFSLILVIIARIYHDNCLSVENNHHTSLDSLQTRNAESPTGHDLLIGGSELERAKKIESYNEIYDYDKLVSTDDDLVALELLRDQKMGFLAYSTTSGGG